MVGDVGRPHPDLRVVLGSAAAEIAVVVAFRPYAKAAMSGELDAKLPGSKRACARPMPPPTYGPGSANANDAGRDAATDTAIATAFAAFMWASSI